MQKDHYGQIIYSDEDLCDLYLRNPSIKLKNILVKNQIDFDDILSINDQPEFVIYKPENLSVEEFDSRAQSIWFFPVEYQNMDIAQWVLDQCKNEAELQRAGKELLLYQDRDMFILLRYLKFLVDTMRKHNIVWGVGRGSSVASFVLFLIGVHRINSLYWDLPIEEFIK